MKLANRISAKQTVILLWCLVVLWAVFIFFMSAHTGTDLDSGNDIVAQVKQWLSGVAALVIGEKVDVVSPIAHFVEYAVFGALIFIALLQTKLLAATKRLDSANQPIYAKQSANAKQLANTKPLMLWILVLGAVAIASLYGVTDEFHQYFVPGRACDPIDWLVDTTGAALGTIIARFCSLKTFDYCRQDAA